MTESLEGKLIEIEWYDARRLDVDESEVNILYHVDKGGYSLLAINKTYGKLKKIYDFVVVLTHEESSTGEVEVSVIPRDWIIKPNVLKYRK